MRHEICTVTSIPQALFKVSSLSIFAPGLHYVARTDELYVAVPDTRTVGLLTPAAPNFRLRPVYTAPAPLQPSAVCLVRQTGTLLVANFEDRNRINRVAFALVALQFESKRWNQQSQLQFDAQMNGFTCNGCTLCEFDAPTVLFGPQFSQQLFLLQVTKAHEVSLLQEVQTSSAYRSVAAAVSSQRTLVALISSQNLPPQVSMHLMRDGRLEPLAKLKLNSFFDNFVMFVGEHLLLAEAIPPYFTQDVVVVECRDTTRTPLTLTRAAPLIPESAGVKIETWCSDGERAFLWDTKSSSILVYQMR